MVMSTTAKISWVLGVMVSMTALLSFAAGIGNPISSYIISVGSAAFADKEIEQDLVEIQNAQRQFAQEFKWLKQNAIREEIYEIRKSQCEAQTQFQKDYYNRKMEELHMQYEDAFGLRYLAPDCREIL